MESWHQVMEDYLRPAAEVLTLLGAGLIVVRVYNQKKWQMCKTTNRMEGKTIIITGGNCGLGKATAQGLLLRGARVILACRNEDKAVMAMEELQLYSGCSSVVYKHLDLSSFSSIVTFAKEIIEEEPQLHVLINNAAVFYNKVLLFTDDQYERQFQVNHLGPSLLSILLLEKLEESHTDSFTPRIISVTSTLASQGIVKQGFFSKGSNSAIGYHPIEKGYVNSKLANLIFNRVLGTQLRTAKSRVRILQASPGLVYTNLGRHQKISFIRKLLFAPIAFCLLRTPWQGCQTILELATNKKLPPTMNGKTFRNCQAYPKFDRIGHEYNQDDIYRQTLKAIKLPNVSIPKQLTVKDTTSIH